MIASEAKEFLRELDAKTTSYDTVRRLSVIHGDGSVFFFSCCYYEVVDNCIFIIPEHSQPQMFFIDIKGYEGDCKWFDVTDL